MDRIYSLLGFAAKMGKLTYGKERIRAYMRSDREKKLVVLAKDASERTKKDVRIRADINNVDVLEMFTKKELGKLVGKAEISVLAIEDDAIIEGIRSG